MTRIEKDRPLPDHTKLDFYECLAKLTLEELFPEHYSGLILADKPDIQGKNIGIEVTMANDRKMQEAQANWGKANYCCDREKKKHYIARMKQLGIEYTGGVQLWSVPNPTFELTQKAIEIKMEKLKGGNYKWFPQYGLFVFSDTWYCDAVVSNAKEFIFDEKVSDCFQVIYVLSQGNDFHIFETKDKGYQNVMIDENEQNERNRRARIMVENAEIQD